VAYTVTTPVFEGPLELLLHLITRQQVDLWEVSLADIVDAYVATLEELRASLDLETATQFLLIAAILLELKARRLLPGPADVDVDEELALWEERDLLLARLFECKTFKDAARGLTRLMDNAALSFPRRAGLEDRFLDLAPDLLAGITAGHLRAAMQAVSLPKPIARVDLDHVAPVRVSVAEAAAALVESLPRAGLTTFRQLAAPLQHRLEVIVCFLALLELFKQGLVDLRQDGNFAELRVEWVGPDDSGGPADSDDFDRSERRAEADWAAFEVEEYQG
jgi:segregation and condensation protein A